jgi:ubiquinone biosynthesis protein UbiJ
VTADPSSPSPLDRLAANAAVVLLNRALAQESWARDKLAPFAGRSARIEAGSFGIALAVTDGGLLAAASGAASVTIALPASALPTLLLDPAAAMRNLRLAGDAEFAQALSSVLTNLKPDAEEELSRWVGDAAAVRIVDTLKLVLAQLRLGGERLAQSTADYFVAENPLLAARAEVDDYGRAVGTLRDDVARLEKRLEHIERLKHLDRLERLERAAPAGEP